MSEPLRVLDFGTASPLRSQTLWHAVAHGVASSGRPTLSFVRSRSGYVCLGYHRAATEVDHGICARRRWPIYRRMVGGGPVLVDDGQLTFQLCVPARLLPPARGEALGRVLRALQPAYRAAGVDAVLDASGELLEGDRKVCGHGAGQVGEAVVVVGNLIERFDHDGAASMLAAPGSDCTAALRGLMRRYVGPGLDTTPDPLAFQDAAIVAVAALLRREPQPGELDETEWSWVERLDQRFESPQWVHGTPRAAPALWRAKVRAGIWLLAGETAGTAVRATIAGGRLVQLVLRSGGFRVPAALCRPAIGRPLAEAVASLGAHPGPLERAARTLQRAGSLAG